MRGGGYKNCILGQSQEGFLGKLNFGMWVFGKDVCQNVKYIQLDRRQSNDFKNGMQHFSAS